MTVPRPEPEDPVALSAREREILADIERQLGGEDLVVPCTRPSRRDSRARHQLLTQLAWFAPALMLVMVVGVGTPVLLQPLAVLLTVGAVVHALMLTRRPR